MDRLYRLLLWLYGDNNATPRETAEHAHRRLMNDLGCMAIMVLLAIVMYLYPHIYDEEFQGPFLPWGLLNLLLLLYVFATL